MSEVDTAIPEDLAKIIREIETNVHRHIDGGTLSRLIRLVYYVALKKGEVINLSIENVLDNSGNVTDRLQVGHKEISLPGHVRELIREQIEHLRNNDGYKTGGHSSVFQMGNGSKYTEVGRHLNKYLKHMSTPKKLILGEIRHEGIRNYYQSLSSDMSSEDCFEATKKFAGLKTDKELAGILKGRIPQAGRKTTAHERIAGKKNRLERLPLEKAIQLLRKGDEMKAMDLVELAEKVGEFDLSGLKDVERFTNAFLKALDENKQLNEVGLSEEEKEKTKTIIKNDLAEALKRNGIVFDYNTGKPSLETD